MKLHNYIDKLPISGEVGIEIEFEGQHLPREEDDYQSLYWMETDEGSLRGPENRELITKRPYLRKIVHVILKDLYSILTCPGTIIHNSDRASIHIHLNVSEDEVIHIFNTIFIYLIFEDMLIKYAGEEREDNLFCVTATNADTILNRIEKAVRKQELFVLGTDELRYASINLKAMIEKMSLEFRALRGTVDLAVVARWIKILTLIQDYGRRIATPREILEKFSESGPEQFFREVFGDDFEDLKYRNWTLDCYRSLRHIQMLLYLPEWQDFLELIEPLNDV